jgi:hypothetical protein
MKDSELKSLFGSYSQQRSKFASELQNEAVSVIQNWKIPAVSAVRCIAPGLFARNGQRPGCACDPGRM